MISIAGVVSRRLREAGHTRHIPYGRDHTTAPGVAGFAVGHTGDNEAEVWHLNVYGINAYSAPELEAYAATLTGLGYIVTTGHNGLCLVVTRKENP